MTEETAFDRIAATIETPMVIVTTRVGDAVDGCLVGFATQCSIEPARYLVCLSIANLTYEIAREASTLVVHPLRKAASDRALARLFGEETAYEVDKLRRCDWDPGPDGVPVLRGLDWFAGRIHSRTEFGDHVGFVIDILDGDASRADEQSLAFTDVRDLDAGNEA